MEIKVDGTDAYGNTLYYELFNVIMSDIGKAITMEKVELVLRPEVPLFIFSVRLKNAPDSMRLKDAASIRDEDKDVFITISDERYAPQILSQLWNRYGRNNVEQSTRFDLLVHDGDADEIGNMIVSSEEEVLKEIIGAVWRSMPEGIRVRQNLIDDNVITIMATEEIIQADMIKETEEVHRRMRDV